MRTDFDDKEKNTSSEKTSKHSSSVEEGEFFKTIYYFQFLNGIISKIKKV